MIRSLIFLFSFLLAAFVAIAALPRLVDKVHLEKSLSLALGTDVTLETVDSFRLLPSPRIKTSGMRVLDSDDPDLALLQDSQRGFSPAMLGLSEAESITLRLSWQRFLADGSLDSLVLSGAKLAPQLDNDRLLPLVRRLASRAQGAEIEVRDTEVTPGRSGMNLPAFRIEQLTIRTNGEGDRLVAGRIHLAGSPEQPQSTAVGIELTLKPIRYLGDGLLQSFDLRLLSSEASSPFGALNASLVGSMQFEDGKAPRLSATLVVKDQASTAEPIMQARLSWQDETLSVTEIAASLAGWQLAGNYWPQALASEDQPAGLTLTASGLPAPVADLGALPQSLQDLRGALERAFSLLELVGLGDMPVALQLPRANFGKLFVEDMDLVLRRSQQGFTFDRLSFNTIANGRFEASAGRLSDQGLALEGRFSCSSPSVMLAELGMQTADLRQRSSLPELVAEGRLSLAPEAVTLDLSRLVLAGDSMRVRLDKQGSAAWQISASGGRLNADYLNQDLAPTQGLAEAPAEWLEQRLAGLPSFDVDLDLADLTVGGLTLGSVQGQIAWRPQDGVLTLGKSASDESQAQALRIGDLLDAALDVRGQVWFSTAPQGGIEALHQFAMVAQANNDRAFLPNRLIRDLGSLANAATPFGLFVPSTAAGVQGLSLRSILGTSQPPSTVVRLNAAFRDGTSVELAAALDAKGGLAAQAQRPLSAIWSIKNAAGLDLPAYLGPDLAQLLPLPMTALEGRQDPGQDPGSYLLRLQTNANTAQGQIEIETYASSTVGLPTDLALVNQLDWILDYDLSGIAPPSQASEALLLDQPQSDFALRGQVSVAQRADGLQLSASNAEIAGLELRALDVTLPRLGDAGGTGRLSGDIRLGALRLAGLGDADPLALWPLEALSGRKFSLNLGLERLDLGGFSLAQVDATALSDGVTLSLQPLSARLGTQPVSGQARLSLGILPQLQLNAQVDGLRQSASVKGTPIELEVGLVASVNALGTNLASMVKNANAELEVSGFGMLRASQPLTLLADYAGRLALDLGPAKALRLQELVFDALANKTLPLSGRLRWVDGALRSSGGLRLGAESDYLRISGRLAVAGKGANGDGQDLGSRDVDLDISLFGDDDLIPKAALEMTGTARRPRFQAFGSALD